MKNKTKGLIALIAMTAATAVAAGSSTFAWFQTNRNANLSFNRITIQKRGANELKAEIIKLGGGSLDKDKQSLTVASPDAMAADISSKDGVQLYAPVWGNKVGDEEKVTRVDEVIDETNTNADKWFTEFAFKLTNVKHGTDTTQLNVFLDKTTLLEAVEVEGYTDTDDTTVETYETAVKNGTIEMSDDITDGITYAQYAEAKTRVEQHNANEAAAKWSRVAIVSLTGAPAENHASVGKGKLGQAGVLTFEKECKEGESDTKNSSTEYINSTALTDSKMDRKEYVAADRHYYSFADPEDYYANAHTAYSDSWVADAKKGYLVTLDPDTGDDANTKYFVVRVWLEGTENDDQELADKGEIKLNLGFASYGIAAA